MPLRRPCFAASLVTAPVNGIALSSPFHNGTESHDSLPLRHSSSFVFLVVALSPLPTFRRCADFPRFLLTFRRCALGPGLSVGPVPAFSFLAAFSHLPKVSDFPTFSAHLPKVRNRPGTLCRACTRVFVSSCLLPPFEGEHIFRVFCSPSEGAHWNGMPDHRLYV